MISLIVSLYVSQKAVFINSVTVERSKWIDKLRENLAEFLRTCSSILLETDKQSPEFKEKQSTFEYILKYFGVTFAREYVDEQVKDFKYIPDAALEYISDKKTKLLYSVVHKLYKNWGYKKWGE